MRDGFICFVVSSDPDALRIGFGPTGSRCRRGDGSMSGPRPTTSLAMEMNPRSTTTLRFG